MNDKIADHAVCCRKQERELKIQMEALKIRVADVINKFELEQIKNTKFGEKVDFCVQEVSMLKVDNHAFKDKVSYDMDQLTQEFKSVQNELKRTMSLLQDDLRANNLALEINKELDLKQNRQIEEINAKNDEMEK